MDENRLLISPLVSQCKHSSVAIAPNTRENLCISVLVVTSAIVGVPGFQLLIDVEWGQFNNSYLLREQYLFTIQCPISHVCMVFILNYLLGNTCQMYVKF